MSQIQNQPDFFAAYNAHMAKRQAEEELARMDPEVVRAIELEEQYGTPLPRFLSVLSKMASAIILVAMFFMASAPNMAGPSVRGEPGEPNFTTSNVLIYLFVFAVTVLLHFTCSPKHFYAPGIGGSITRLLTELTRIVLIIAGTVLIVGALTRALQDDEG